MNLRKFLTILIILVMGSTTILPNLSATNIDSNSITTLETPKSHVIKNVPYVSQETNFYCDFASSTMLFKYQGINTNLSEVLYLTGTSFSLAYQDRSIQPGFFISKNYTFISDLYNLSYSHWSLNITGKSEENCWNEYWTRVKQNISNNIPLKTFAIINLLESFRRVSDIPDFILDIMPGSGHAFVIVGYNENNNTVCFNDPYIGAIDNPEKGYYVWMDLTEFKNAVWAAAEFHQKFNDVHMSIETFTKISDPPSKEIIYKQAYLRNIEKLKGNISSYDADFVVGNISKKFGSLVGLKALEKLNEDFKSDLYDRILTVKKLKQKNKRIPVLMKIFRILGIVDNGYISSDDLFGTPYFTVLTEKNYLMQFLNENNDSLQLSNEELLLYQQEIENWIAFYQDYNIFMNKGLRLGIIRGLFLINEMSKKLENIIEIEQDIIDLATEGKI